VGHSKATYDTLALHDDTSSWNASYYDQNLSKDFIVVSTVFPPTIFVGVRILSECEKAVLVRVGYW